MRYLQHSSPLILASLLTLSPGCGGDGEFPDEDGSVSEFMVSLAVSPDDRHMGEELTLTFTLTHHGEPASDVMPMIEFEGPSSGTIPITPGSEPGTFVGVHTFGVAGSHMVHMHFTAEGTDVELPMTLVIVEPDGMH